MRAWIAEEIFPHQPQRTFGSGGTINSVHKMLENSSKQPVTINQLNELIKKIEGLSMEERLVRFPIKEDRADVIVPAMEIYATVLDALNLSEIYVPKMGLSDGVLLDLYRDKTL
jgi:exopolyphosphatase/guanosine-5'-triphosphate,3'-diphosphate pyrophosphatase